MTCSASSQGTSSSLTVTLPTTLGEATMLVPEYPARERSTVPISASWTSSEMSRVL